MTSLVSRIIGVLFLYEGWTVGFVYTYNYLSERKDGITNWDLGLVIGYFIIPNLLGTLLLRKNNIFEKFNRGKESCEFDRNCKPIANLVLIALAVHSLLRDTGQFVARIARLMRIKDNELDVVKDMILDDVVSSSVGIILAIVLIAFSRRITSKLC